MVRDSRPANSRTVGVQLSEVNLTPLYYMGSCDDQYQSFSSVMNNIIDQYLPLRRVKIDSNDKPWITPEIMDLISNGLTFRFYRNKINALCKKARSSYYRNNGIADVQNDIADVGNGGLL